MDNLADELEAIAGAPEPDPVEQLRHTGQQLVDALRDQFVDGQAETLYSLQTASAQLRSHVAALESLAGSLADGVRRQVTTALERVLADLQASIGEQLANEVDSGSAELRGAARDHAQAVAAQLEQTRTDLTSLYEAGAARAEHARDGLEWVAQQGAEQLTTAASSLAQARAASEEALTAAAATLSAQVRAAGDQARQELAAVAADSLRQLREGADEVLAKVRTAQEELNQQLVDARRAAAEELTALREQIASAERREASVAERLQEQFEAFALRTDATVGTTLRHLQSVVEALVDREAKQESQRADEFVRVLEAVLQQGGASTRRLRDRVLRGLESGRDRPPVVSPPPATAPAATPPAKAATPPAKKAPARKRAPRATPPPSTPPAQEDKA